MNKFKRRSPISWAVRLIGMSVLGMLAVKFTGIYSENDLLAKLDSFRSTGTLVAEQKQMLREDASNVNAVQGERMRLDRQVSTWQRRQDMLDSKVESSRTVMRTMRRSLHHCCGEQVMVCDGVQVAKSDVEQDLAEHLHQMKQWLAEREQLVDSISVARGHMKTMDEAMSELRGDLNRRNSDVRQWEMDSMISTVHASSGSTSSEIEDQMLANHRWDDVASELESRATGSIRAETSSRPWSNWSAGHASDTEAMLAEVDSLIGAEPGPQDEFFSAGNVQR